MEGWLTAATREQPPEWRNTASDGSPELDRKRVPMAPHPVEPPQFITDFIYPLYIDKASMEISYILLDHHYPK